MQADEAQLGPFSWAPAKFALDRKESLQIQVAYRPEVAGRREQEFVLACDNGTCAVYKLSGNGKSIKFAKLDLLSSLQFPDQLCAGVQQRNQHCLQALWHWEAHQTAKSQINFVLACNNVTSTVYKLSGIGKDSKFSHTHLFKSWPNLITPNTPAESQMSCVLACDNGSSNVYKLSGISKAAQFATLWVASLLQCFKLTAYYILSQALMPQTHTSDQ